MTTPSIRRARRCSRLAVAADAWHHPGEPAGSGNLDVPLSVWACPDTASLIAGLVRELSPDRAAVAVCGISEDEQAAVTGRRVTVFGDHQTITDTHQAAGDAVATRFVTVHNLANHLTATPEPFTLLVASLQASRGEGFWSAARRALAPGGFLAVVTGSRRPTVHAVIARRAVATGLDYVHHVIATTPTALSRAVDGETASLSPDVKLRHVRAHRDVLVYQRPVEAT